MTKKLTIPLEIAKCQAPICCDIGGSKARKLGPEIANVYSSVSLGSVQLSLGVEIVNLILSF